MEMKVANEVPLNESMLQDFLQGNMEAFLEFIRQGQTNSRNLMGSTPLHLVAKSGNVEMVEKLLEHGASIFLKDLFGFLPLHIASMHGHVKVVQLLLNKGCDVDMSSKAKITPLHCAAERGKSEVVRFLIQNGANLNAQNCYDQTPLMLAMYGRHEEAVKLLVEAGSDLLLRDKTSMSIFHIAAGKSSPACLQILLENVGRGRMLDIRNEHDMTPFYFASMHLINQRDRDKEVFEKLKMLVQAGASPAIQLAARSYYSIKPPSIFQTLVVRGNVDAVSLILQVNLRKHVIEEVNLAISKLNKGLIESPSKDMAGLLQSYVSNASSLKHSCRLTIRDNMDARYQSICRLPLPLNLKKYLSFSDLC